MTSTFYYVLHNGLALDEVRGAEVAMFLHAGVDLEVVAKLEAVAAAKA